MFVHLCMQNKNIPCILLCNASKNFSTWKVGRWPDAMPVTSFRENHVEYTVCRNETKRKKNSIILYTFQLVIWYLYSEIHSVKYNNQPCDECERVYENEYFICFLLNWKYIFENAQEHFSTWYASSILSVYLNWIYSLFGFVHKRARKISRWGIQSSMTQFFFFFWKSQRRFNWNDVSRCCENFKVIDWTLHTLLLSSLFTFNSHVKFYLYFCTCLY